MTREHYMEGHPLYVPWSKLTEAVQLIDPLGGENYGTYLHYLHHKIEDQYLPFVLNEARKLAFIVGRITPRGKVASSDVRTATELLGIKPEALHFRIFLDINHLATRLSYFSEKDRKAIKQSLIKTLYSQLDQVSASRQQTQP